MTLLQAHGISFRYSGGTHPAVKDVSFNLSKGEFVGIVGPNGSGKSTLLKLLYGALSPYCGRVVLQGRALGDWPRKGVAQKIAVVGQEPVWNFPITVRDFVLQGRYPYLGRFGFERKQDVQLVGEALANTHLSDLAERTVQQLSAGERQRMLLARALAQAPEIFMLDEPIANLDLRYQVELLELMCKLQRELGFTVLMISHEVNLIVGFVHRLVLFKAGEILADGESEEVTTPANFEKLFGVPFQLHSSGKERQRFWIHPAVGNGDRRTGDERGLLK
jgi:iron complex transport system ATP-binding protein